MQATLTTATYDAEKNIVIPQERPRFNNFKQVLVLFVPQINIEDPKAPGAKALDLLEENWQSNYNRTKDLTDDQVMEIALEAQQAVRRQKRENSKEVIL